METSSLRILMASSECFPYAKTGGLADAVPALSNALARQGHDVTIMMPRYYTINREGLKKLEEPLCVTVGSQKMWCAVYETQLSDSNVRVFLFDREDLYGRDGLYGPNGSQSWPDNALRFAFFSTALFQLCRYLKWIPNILHLHDWQTGPAAWLLKTSERKHGFENTTSVITIHNLGYQGIFGEDVLRHFPPASPNQTDYVLNKDGVNFLATGISCADAVTTVSPTYAKEILTPTFSEGLEKILLSRKKNLIGILNGMEYKEWNTEKDKALSPDNYSWLFMKGKLRLKKRLQDMSNLPIAPNIPVIGMISRLTSQKGLDLIINPLSPALSCIKEGLAQLIILGSGERHYEEKLQSLATTYPHQCSVRIGFSGDFSRLVEAGSDFFLMPSVYEPCGLNQMYSLRYGTFPIVRETGGLADTILDISSHGKKGNGFVFSKSHPKDAEEAIRRAIHFYRDRRHVNAARRRIMRQRFDWKSSALKYVEVYKKTMMI